MPRVVTRVLQVSGPPSAGSVRTGADRIGVRVGKAVNQYKVAKHFELRVGERTFTFARKADSIAA
jgi:hypothetical protein